MSRLRHALTTMPQSVLQLDPRDNVLIALTDLKAPEHVEFGGHGFTLSKNVPDKHKFAMRDFAVGDAIKRRKTSFRGSEESRSDQ
jgi:hypothetical protein